MQIFDFANVKLQPKYGCTAAVGHFENSSGNLIYVFGGISNYF